MTTLKNIFITSIFIFSPLSLAQSDIPPTISSQSDMTAVQNNAAVPTLPDDTDGADDSRNIPQPEVRIIRKKDTVIEEYRVNGRLRFIKITPSIGYPYYMVDTDGDGILETRNDNFANPPINQWILLEW